MRGKLKRYKSYKVTKRGERRLFAHFGTIVTMELL
jgi:hypothetical protein